MSFEDTARNLHKLFQLSSKVIEACRRACGEQEPLTRELTSLYDVVCQLQREAEKPNSSLRWQDDVGREDLETTICSCQKLLKVLDSVIQQCSFPRRKWGSKKGLFKNIQVKYHGEVRYMTDLVKELSVHKAAFSSNLRLLTPSSRGSLEWPLGKKFPRMQQSLHRMMEKKSSSHDGSSLSSSYSDDERTVWNEIRKGLIRDGWGHVVKKHKRVIKEYVKTLGWNDSFDEIRPADSESMNRYPEDSHRNEPYSPEIYPQEAFPPPDFPQQDFRENTSHQSFPPPNFPIQNIPQNFSHQDFPQHDFPQHDFPENISQQSLPPPQFPQQNFPPRDLPQHEFPENISQPSSPPNFPSQNLSPQHFPQQTLPLHNFSQQSFPPQHLPPQNLPQQNFSQDTFPQQNSPQQNFSQRILPPPNLSEANFVHEALPRVYPQEHDSQSHHSESAPCEPVSIIPPPLYIPPSVSEDCQQFDEKAGFKIPPQTEPHFSARPYDLADNFECSEKDTWNDMIESLVTTLVDTSKNIYFPCSICKKMTATAQARLDRSQNWCRNCFHAIVYNVLYYPATPPEWCRLRPISEKRMRDILTPKFEDMWTNSYEMLRDSRGRPGGMLVPSLEEPPLLLYRYPAVQDEVTGKTLRTSYFEITYFEEPFSSFVARRKQRSV